MTAVLERTAGAPISWGVCEVPGWGTQLSVDRVLTEMRSIGLSATELGPVGYLPRHEAELGTLLDSYDLSLIGGFNALALGNLDEADDVLALVTESVDLLAATGAITFVSCAVSDPTDWRRPELNDAQWAHMLIMLDRIDEICAERGLAHVFHPHVDSLVETAAEIDWVLDHSDVPLVLDTGHMGIGGFDPLRFAKGDLQRIGLVHLKDYRQPIADRFNANEVTLMEAVQEGLFPPLGEGDAHIADVIRALENAGYQGWYVIEQDVALTEGEPAADEGPVLGMKASLAFLRELDAAGA